MKAVTSVVKSLLLVAGAFIVFVMMAAFLGGESIAAAANICRAPAGAACLFSIF